MTDSYKNIESADIQVFIDGERYCACVSATPSVVLRHVTHGGVIDDEDALEWIAGDIVLKDGPQGRTPCKCCMGCAYPVEGDNFTMWVPYPKLWRMEHE